MTTQTYRSTLKKCIDDVTVTKTVVNFFLVEAESRRRWDIFQAEVTLY